MPLFSLVEFPYKNSSGHRGKQEKKTEIQRVNKQLLYQNLKKKKIILHTVKSSTLLRFDDKVSVARI